MGWRESDPRVAGQSRFDDRHAPQCLYIVGPEGVAPSLRGVRDRCAAVDTTSP